LQLIVESDGPLGACVEALFRNSWPTCCRTAISRMFGCLTPADRVRCQQPSQRGL